MMTREQIEALQGYTPGPWVHDGDGLYIFTVADTKLIAEIRGWGWLQYKGEPRAIAEQTANGYMLAAAPDLRDTALALMDERDRLKAALDAIDPVQRAKGILP